LTAPLGLRVDKQVRHLEFGSVKQSITGTPEEVPT